MSFPDPKVGPGPLVPTKHPSFPGPDFAATYLSFSLSSLTQFFGCLNWEGFSQIAPRRGAENNSVGGAMCTPASPTPNCQQLGDPHLLVMGPLLCTAVGRATRSTHYQSAHRKSIPWADLLQPCRGSSARAQTMERAGRKLAH